LHFDQVRNVFKPASFIPHKTTKTSVSERVHSISASAKVLMWFAIPVIHMWRCYNTFDRRRTTWQANL